MVKQSKRSKVRARDSIEIGQHRSEGLAALTDHASEESELLLYMDTLQPFYG